MVPILGSFVHQGTEGTKRAVPNGYIGDQGWYQFWLLLGIRGQKRLKGLSQMATVLGIFGHQGTKETKRAVTNEYIGDQGW